MPQMPLKLSQLGEPIVQAEEDAASMVAQAGLPTVPGPAALTKDALENAESMIEQQGGLPQPSGAAPSAPSGRKVTRGTRGPTGGKKPLGGKPKGRKI